MSEVGYGSTGKSRPIRLSKSVVSRKLAEIVICKASKTGNPPQRGGSPSVARTNPEE